MRTLVIYATEEGQTEKISRRIAKQLIQRGFPTDCQNIGVDPEDPIALDAYDAVVIGSPVHYSHYDARLAAYITRYREALREIPSAFFSVSLGILSEQAEEKEEPANIADDYLSQIGWNPPMRDHFAGAIVYSKYRWLKRKLIQFVVRKGGGPTDTRFDYEFTNWDQVDQFVDQFVEFVESCKRPDEEFTQRSIHSRRSRRYSIRNRDRRKTVPGRDGSASCA